MYEPILAWAGLAVLFLLCLPFVGARKVVLEVCAWGLRAVLLATLAGGAFLWFRPEQTPAAVYTALETFPQLRDLLPAVGTPLFGLAAACLVTAVFLPLLAVFDVTRRLAGYDLRRRPVAVVAPAPEPVAVVDPAATAYPLGRPGPMPRRPDRRAAAEAMAEVGSRKPFRVADQVR